VKRILIVEDDREISLLEADYLEISGFSVELAFDGAEGLKLALENDYDLLLLDLMLPGVDGFEICKTVRKEKDIPILMVTAQEDSIDKIRGLGLGADDYIVKPFDPAELVARVTAHLNRYERLTGRVGAGAQTETREQWVGFGRLRIGLQSRRVLVEDADIRLTNKEFELLSFLATNPNIVFSKDHLFEEIWGLDAAGDTATVTVHINRIREKIEADPARPQIIHTVWGAGYRFGNA
jgi:DNA-binding response OmpR family regulator